MIRQLGAIPESVKHLCVNKFKFALGTENIIYLRCSIKSAGIAVQSLIDCKQLIDGL